MQTSRWPDSMCALQRCGMLFVRPGLLLMSLLLSLSACDLVLDRSENRETLRQIEVDATQLAYRASRVRHGDLGALVQLDELDRTLEQSMKALVQQDDPSTNPWQALSRQWQQAHAQVQRVLAGQTLLERDAELHDQVTALCVQLQSSVMALVHRDAEAGTPDGEEQFAMMRLVLVLERVQARLPRALAGGDDAMSAYDSIARDAGFLSTTLERLRHGEPTPESTRPAAAAPKHELDDLIEAAAPLFHAIDELIEQSITRLEVSDALIGIESEALKLADTSRIARLAKP